MIIKIIESGINLSCYINNIDWDELTYKFSHLYNPDFVNKICRKLINEIKNQYNLPDFVIPRLYDYKDEFLCELYTIATLVKNNKNPKTKLRTIPAAMIIARFHFLIPSKLRS